MLIRRFPTFKIADTEMKSFIDDLHKLINGRNISFGTSVNSGDRNIQGFMVEIADSGIANSSITINHNLGYIPKFVDVKYANRATQVFDFGTTWTKTKAFVASSTANTKLRLFIH